MPSTLNEFLDNALNERAPKFKSGGGRSEQAELNIHYAKEGIKRLEDSLIWINPFVKDGLLKKGTEKAVKKAIADLNHIIVRGGIAG